MENGVRNPENCAVFANFLRETKHLTLNMSSELRQINFRNSTDHESLDGAL